MAWSARSDRARRLSIAAAIVGILLLPLAAMQVSEEVAWSLLDFAAAATLLCGAGAAYELTATLSRDPRRRKVAAAAIAAILAVVWAHGAVGLFD